MSTIEELEHEAAEVAAEWHDEKLLLIAKVIAWTEGVRPGSINSVAREVGYMDAAQQAAEDLGIA